MASVPPSIPPQDTRRQLLRLVLRETLQASGIPFDWIQAEALQAVAPSREGIHVRFLICQWQPRLFTYCFAFQRDFKARVLAIDPMARTWLMGFSWQYALPPGTAFPALPPPHTWAESIAGDDTAQATELRQGDEQLYGEQPMTDPAPLETPAAKPPSQG